MTASEILADNLRRLMQGQESLDWAEMEPPAESTEATDAAREAGK